MSRRPRIMTDDERALAGSRARVKTPAFGVPIEHPDMDPSDLTPPPQVPPRLRSADPHLADELEEWVATMWQHVASVNRRTNNRVAEVHQGVVAQGSFADRLGAIEGLVNTIKGWMRALAITVAGSLVGAGAYVYSAGDKAGVARERAAHRERELDALKAEVLGLRGQIQDHRLYHAQGREGARAPAAAITQPTTTQKDPTP